MADLTWRDAILKVLSEADEPLHYTAIAEAIAEQELRSDLGATPATSVSAIIASQLQGEVTRVTRGYYALAPSSRRLSRASEPPSEDEQEDTGLINAFGMYWDRTLVLWTGAPRLLGRQQPGSSPVDFSNQRGVYLLHDGRDVIYVGRTTEQPLGTRLRQHTVDRLNGRWNRFSWFGVFAPSESGALNTAAAPQYDLDMLITTMEALLIEGLEPPQNRKRGDDFKAVEYLQVEDPEIQRNRIVELMDRLKLKL